MKIMNAQGEAVYYNIVEKRGKLYYIVKAISGQTIRGRDREKRKSRSFSQQHQAEAWLKRMGYFSV